MKALSLTQPWATAIAAGVKRVETRSWGTLYRGRIAIHAAKGFPGWAREFAADECAAGRVPSPASLPRGAVLATAELYEVRRTVEVVETLSAVEQSYGDYGPGRWAWMLRDVRMLATPIAARGALGLWEWTAPADLDARYGLPVGAPT